jgi:predicted transposase YdaD
VLSQTTNPAGVLERVARKIEGIEDEAEQNNVAASAAVIAGLILDTMTINRLLTRDIMRESVIYQEIQAEEAAKLVMRLLKRRFEEIPQNLTEKIIELPVEEIESLGEALLDFQSLSDLVSWLERSN